MYQSISVKKLHQSPWYMAPTHSSGPQSANFVWKKRKHWIRADQKINMMEWTGEREKVFSFCRLIRLLSLQAFKPLSSWLIKVLLKKKNRLPEFWGDIVKICVQFWNFICRNATKSFWLLKTFKDSFEIKWNNLINLISYRPGSKILAWRGFHWIWARLYELEVRSNLDFSAFNLGKESKKENGNFSWLHSTHFHFPL